MTKRRIRIARAGPRCGGTPNSPAGVAKGWGDAGVCLDQGPESSEATPDPTPQQDARMLGDVVERFRSLHPADWEQLRLCPLQHGLETMVRKLRAYR